MSGCRNILLTGRPGVGKTTLIRRLADRLRAHEPAGFYTAEIRENDIRRGFELIGLDGIDRLVLSHVDIGGAHRVGKYGVDIARFDEYLLGHDFAMHSGRLIVIDEIGKMECFSRLFIDMIQRLLESQKMLVATVARKGGGSIARIRSRPDIELIEVTTANRNSLVERLAAQVHRVL